MGIGVKAILLRVVIIINIFFFCSARYRLGLCDKKRNKFLRLSDIIVTYYVMRLGVIYLKIFSRVHRNG